jgi:hypothetical protein
MPAVMWCTTTQTCSESDTPCSCFINAFMLLEAELIHRCSLLKPLVLASHDLFWLCCLVMHRRPSHCKPPVKLQCSLGSLIQREFITCGDQLSASDLQSDQGPAIKEADELVTCSPLA